VVAEIDSLRSWRLGLTRFTPRSLGIDFAALVFPLPAGGIPARRRMQKKAAVRRLTFRFQNDFE